MARRILKPEPTPEPDWRDKSRMGTPVRIRGERGNFVVVYEAAAGTPHGEHVCLFGGSHTQTRHVRPDAVVWPRRKRSTT
jgi:hypothetical protein